MGIKFLENSVIYCIGDSHTSLFSGLNKIMPVWPNNDEVGHLCQFKVYHIGPALAFNLIEDISATQSKDKLLKLLKEVIPQQSWVLLCFGEIDCRAHLIKQAKKTSQSWEVVAERCADRYFRAAKLVIELGHNLIIYNAIPSARKNKPNTEYPTYGDCVDRNQMTLLFNHYLKKNCKTYSVPFVDTFDKLVNRKGLTKKHYYMDRIHLSQKAIPLTMDAISNAVPGFLYQQRSFKSAIKVYFSNLLVKL